jgi:hypothetical protein
MNKLREATTTNVLFCWTRVLAVKCINHGSNPVIIVFGKLCLLIIEARIKIKVNNDFVGVINKQHTSGLESSGKDYRLCNVPL